MKQAKTTIGFLLFTLACTVATSAGSLPVSGRLTTTRRSPDAFGTITYSATTVSATAFYPSSCGVSGCANYATSGSLGRFVTDQSLTEFYAAIDLPAGVVIDYIGLNSVTDTDFAFGVQLFNRHQDGSLDSIATFSSTAHGWDTDFNATPIGYLWDGKTGEGLVLNVEEAALPNLEFFGWVEVWWRRVVSPPPASASFDDVPTTHPFFQYVEALKASGITGGCSTNPPLFCPDTPLTRGQMAVFLSKALGLFWPEVGYQYGTYRLTAVPAVAFYPGTDSVYGTVGSDFSRYGPSGTVTDFYAALDLPGGAVVDYIGLNDHPSVHGALSATLFKRHKDGGLTTVGSVLGNPHDIGFGWDTDVSAGPLGFVWTGKTGDALILQVEQASTESLEYFGWVEVWWKPSVSPAPDIAQFNDVPTTHPFFQFIEALWASGISGGCSAYPPLFCPDSTLTRGQMAVFLAKALGLHWPGATAPPAAHD